MARAREGDALFCGWHVKGRTDRQDARAGSRSSGTRPPAWRVLIIDDDATFATALRGVLTRRGWDVTTAATVAQATDALARRPHRVVLSIPLEQGSGVELLQRIYDCVTDVRVIVTTTDESRLKQIRQFEPHALLRKPIDLGELLDALGPRAGEG